MGVDTLRQLSSNTRRRFIDGSIPLGILITSDGKSGETTASLPTGYTFSPQGLRTRTAEARALRALNP